LRSWLDIFILGTIQYIGGAAAALILGFLGWKLKSKGLEMLEGKEVDVAIGNIGHASVDLDDKGNLEVGLSAKIDLLAELEKIAAKTGTQLDDAFVATLKKLLGRA
jgi:hypothetical protein